MDKPSPSGASAANARGKSPCDCIEIINRTLAPKGEEVTTLFAIREERSFIAVPVRKIDGGRGKTTMLMGNFCPLCGTRVFTPPAGDA